MNEIATTLHSLLAHNIVSFTFRKVDGTIRKAIGTRNLALAEIHTCTTIPTPKGEEQPNSYYDVEKMGWRSYKPENLISIDGVYAREDTDFAKKPTTPNVETKRGELPKREIPIVEMPKHYDDDPIDLGFIVKPTDGGDLRKPDINAIIGGLFGGMGAPLGGIRESWDKLGKEIDIVPPTAPAKVGIPTPTEKGIALPIGEISVEDFAKMVAHYVVDELVTRLTR